MDANKRTGPVLWLACGAAFLALLDVTVVNLAIPDLLKSYRSAQVTDVSWVITLYATVFAALLAPAGRLADVIGRRALFVSGVGLFTAMSLLCALSPNLATLLVARAVQGAGAATMIPASLAIVLADSRPERRTAAISMWSAAAALAAALGPALGGILVDQFGWRSVFVINVPIGLAFLVFARVIPVGRLDVARRLPDIVGTVLLGAAVGLAVLGVTEGHGWGWANARTLGCFAGVVVALAVALWRSSRHPVPALEIGLWRSHTFAWANLASLLYGAAVFGWMLASVLFLTEIWRYRELSAGLAMSPTAILTTVVAIATGRLVLPRLGLRVTIAVGALVIAVGLGLYALAIPQQPHFLTFFLPAAAVGAIGIGAVTTGVSTAAALSVAPQRFAAATGLNQTARQIGGALGVAILAAILAGYSGSRLDAYRLVFGIFTAFAVATAIVGLFIGNPVRPAAPSPGPVAVPAGSTAQPAATDS